ncbi:MULTISPECIES: BON domain-containing protein [unclassified Achromobacter]|uniref:BON domain-containing protein n=1 Tax=unclassified Achromobacter TaxID=2626865 RepID=UPI00069DA819|nr:MULTISPECIES: BON domain-containing protein [unclassified Achromobacter]KOF54362.1 phospholipid-binding protein [Achromobacter sp. DMS1]
MELRKLIAAAALGTGAAFSCIALAADDGKPKQSVGEYASDAAITTKVKAAFVADKQLSALDIAVETNNGVTTLTGTVGTAAEADHAAQVTRAIEGVKQVKNDIKVDPAKAKKS